MKRSRARSAAAPATRTSSTRSAGRPSKRARLAAASPRPRAAPSRRPALRRLRPPGPGWTGFPETPRDSYAAVTQEREVNVERTQGYGRLKRKEDARFIRGQGRYLDDIKLPGMLHGALLRSPYAHARIVSIDTSRALAHPNVTAVVTAKDLETLGPGLDADDLLRHAGRARRRQGPLPGPGGRVRRGRRIAYAPTTR